MRLRTTLFLTVSGTAAGILWAQSVPPSPSGPPSPRDSRPASAASQPSRTPSEEFRQLLAMSAPDREKALMGKPQQLRAILKEYDALSPGDREIRLRMSELRYYLVPLMTAPPSKRAPLLARVPAKDSKLVLDRLAKWDRLAPELQKEVLENEWMMTAITRYGQDGSSQGPAMDSMPAERRKQIEEGKKAFQQLSSEKRDRMIQNFGQVLGMDEREKARILDQVPSNQRQKMISTLQEFEKLPAKERPEVIKSLKEFTSMNPIEQARFFDDAERWSHLSETERATFRKLITQMPPLPPGLGDLPPLPLDTGDKPPFSGSIVHKP